MSRSRAFEHYITPDDRIDIELIVDQGAVVDFTANYRARIGGRWVEVVRYDTAHGHLHVHRFWRPEPDRIDTLEPPDNPADDYSAALDRAEEDLVENWRAYRNLMEDHLT